MAVLIAILGAVVTLSSSLFITIPGLAVFTFGFFGAHAVASSWVGVRAVNHRAQASSLYLLFYYTGSSVAGAVGGLFWMHFGWRGVVSMLTILLVLAVFSTVHLLAASRREAIG